MGKGSLAPARGIGDGESDVVSGCPGIRSFLVGQGSHTKLASRAAGMTKMCGVAGAILMMKRALKESKSWA